MMERKKFVIVTAGGTGTRMGASVPKQFLELKGKPILRLTIEKFLEAEPGIHVITVLPEAHVATWREYCIKADFNCPQRLVKGGFTRFHSVKNALEYVPEGALVAVQDGVRPLLSVEKIRTLFAAAENVPALVPVLPVTDTLKVLKRRPTAPCRQAASPSTVAASMVPRPRRFSTVKPSRPPTRRAMTPSSPTTHP